MAKVQGTCDERFAELRNVFQQRLDSGDDLGAAITVNIDGKNVVDIWGGYDSADRSRLWDEDTIVNVWSSSKTILSLAILMLVDRGLLDAHENVAKYWPEFAANGKEHVKVKHLLSHTAGLSGWEQPIGVDDLYDGAKATRLLAEQAPWWEPGTASGYHALTMGYLLGELVVRVTGRTMSQFVAEEIAAPLGADFQFGAAESDWPRIAALVPDTASGSMGRALPADVPEIAGKTLRNPGSDAAAAMTPGWRRAEIGAANGHSNARALARMLSVIALGGEVDGVRLLSPETIRLVFEEQAHGVDLVLGRPVQFGIGYGICTAGDSAVNAMLPRGRLCYWSGWGGSLVVADTERRMTFSYTMNRMWIRSGTLGNENTLAYARAIYAALGVKVGEQ